MHDTAVMTAPHARRLKLPSAKTVMAVTATALLTALVTSVAVVWLMFRIAEGDLTKHYAPGYANGLADKQKQIIEMQANSEMAFCIAERFRESTK